MKKLSIALFLFTGFWSGDAGAQTWQRRAPFQHASRPVILQRVLEAQASPDPDVAAKPTAFVQRMVAEVVYQQGGVPSDSFRYSYASAQRGADHNPKIPYSYFPFEYSPFGEYATTVGYGSGRRQYIQMDSATRYDISGLAADPPVMLLRNIYNAANKLTVMEHLEDGPLTVDRRYNVTYNAAGDPVSCTFYDRYPTSTLTLNATQTTTFNAQHMPVTDSIFTHAFGNVPEIRSLYTYNTAGAVTQWLSQHWNNGAWQNSQRTILTYNAAGLLQTTINEDYVSSAWLPDFKDSFVYAGANPSYTAEYGYGWDAGSNSWTPSSRTLAHLNAAGNWDTLRTQYYNDQTMMWGNLSRVTLTYNAYNNWETYTDAYDDDDNGVIDPATEVYGYTRYYYELWNNSLGTPEVRAQTSSFKVYPNPAFTHLRVDWSSESPARYTLTDLAGRTVSAGPILPGSARMELSLEAVPAGVYLFTAFDNTGVPLHREKVARQ